MHRHNLDQWQHDHVFGQDQKRSEKLALSSSSV